MYWLWYEEAMASAASSASRADAGSSSAASIASRTVARANTYGSWCCSASRTSSRPVSTDMPAAIG